MNCPKCHATMEPVAYQTITVERCTACKGIFFDAGETQKLRELKGSEAIDIGDATTGKSLNKIDDIDCPKCHTRMIKMVDTDQHHIWFEACKVCHGAFFDAGEFKDLKTYNIADYIKGLFNKERR